MKLPPIIRIYKKWSIAHHLDNITAPEKKKKRKKENGKYFFMELDKIHYENFIRSHNTPVPF